MMNRSISFILICVSLHLSFFAQASGDGPVMACSVPQTQNLQDVKDLLPNYSQINACVPLQVGETRDVHVGIPGMRAPNFRLTKKIDPKDGREYFEADVSLEFTDSKGNTSSAFQQDGEAMFNRCFAALGEYILGPDQQRLKVKQVPVSSREDQAHPRSGSRRVLSPNDQRQPHRQT